jgi:hypothetical protein
MIEHKLYNYFVFGRTIKSGKNETEVKDVDISTGGRSFDNEPS